jgi:hypothetical protein
MRRVLILDLSVSTFTLVHVVLSLIGILSGFIVVAQAFQKLSFLHTLAPTPSEPPLAVAQLVVLAIFVVLGRQATKRFQPRGSAGATP